MFIIIIVFWFNKTKMSSHAEIVAYKFAVELFEQLNINIYDYDDYSSVDFLILEHCSVYDLDFFEEIDHLIEDDDGIIHFERESCLGVPKTSAEISDRIKSLNDEKTFLKEELDDIKHILHSREESPKKTLTKNLYVYDFEIYTLETRIDQIVDSIKDINAAIENGKCLLTFLKNFDKYIEETYKKIKEDEIKNQLEKLNEERKNIVEQINEFEDQIKFNTEQISLLVKKLDELDKQIESLN